MGDRTADDVLVDAHVLEFPGGYKRSVGPVVGRFLTGLRDGELLGVRTPSGKVLVPPAEYDPETSAAVGEDPGDFVAVGPEGVVTTWAWVRAPRPKQPLDRPFAWALIRLDGADTRCCTRSTPASEDAVRTGMRVRAAVARPSASATSPTSSASSRRADPRSRT